MPEARVGRGRFAVPLTSALAVATGVVLVSTMTGAPSLAVVEDDGVTADTVVVDGGDEVVLELEDGRRFVGALRLRAAADGSLSVVNDVTMDDYLAGVAEMPPRWHEEALKAQAVAARTYAWRSIRRGTFDDRGYDICATVDCQVFRGAEVVEERTMGERWRDAVRATSSEVLLDDDGAPILARYFSTSGGRTVPNELVFPESGSFDYLRGVDDPDDAIAPLHRWRVELTREEFDDILGRGETLAAAVPVADVERRGDLHDPHAPIVVTGEDGTEAEVPAVRFREFVSRVAPDRHPDRFPARRSDGGSMPATLPSSRFEVEVDDSEVIIEGRGWGHGVGMGQYGALGKARRGLTYDEILASYYDGLTPTRHEDVPERVRVGMSAPSETTVRADAPVRVLADGDELTTRSMGAWRVRVQDGRLRLEPPPGHADPIEVAPTALAASPVEGADHVLVETRVNKPVELTLEVRDEHGELVVERAIGVADPGEHAATWRLTDDDGERVDAGEYDLALVGVDAQSQRAGEPVTVSVAATEDAGLVSGRTAPAALAFITILAAVATVGLAHRRRR